jgi:DNA polymerase-3 subunit chi
MTRVVFYLSPEETEEARWRTACRLIDKAYRQGFSLYAHLSTAEEVQQFDDLLWTFKEDAFIPHSVYGTRPEFPVHVGYNQPALDKNMILVNLTPVIPDFHAQSQHIIEVVRQEPAARELGRKHYRFYRDQGYTLESHTL